MRLLLSCISTKHSVLKRHWTDTNQVSQVQLVGAASGTSRAGQVSQASQSSQLSQTTSCPLTVLGSYQKPKEDLGGLLCLLEDMGCSRKTFDLKMAAGMVNSERGVFVTSFAGVHEINTDTGSMQENIVSSPLFNALHSISRTQRGYLVASTGLDLLLEFNREGEILWSWWATDHGFNVTPTGELRTLDKTADYRDVRYGTLSQTTHINSAAELPSGKVLATLFHQGMVIAIDRQTGFWQPVLEGLDHPHSVRILDENRFSVADTVRGRALLVRIKDGEGQIEEEVDAGTNWLQDCRYDERNNCWILVDGKHSRIVLRRGQSGKKALAQFDCDPEWRLYEAHVL